LRYVGRLAKLYPEDNLQATRVDELIDAFEDLSSKMAPVFYEKDEEAKKQGLEKINNEILPHWVNLIEKRVEKFGKGGHAVGDHLTIVDIKIAVVVGSFLVGKNPYLQGISSDSLKKAPRLLEIHKKVLEHPKVVEWNKKLDQNLY